MSEYRDMVDPLYWVDVRILSFFRVTEIISKKTSWFLCLHMCITNYNIILLYEHKQVVTILHRLQYIVSGAHLWAPDCIM